MRRIIAVTVFAMMIIMLQNSQVFAEDLFVRDTINLPIRMEPNENGKVTGIITTGSSVKSLEETPSGWVKVSAANGSKGWISKKFLSREIPRSSALVDMNNKYKEQFETMRQLQDRNDVLEKENLDLKNSQILSERQDVLKSREYIELNAAHTRMKDENKIKATQVNELSSENIRLKTSERVKFTLLGGGFIIFGMILGGVFYSLVTRPKKTGYRM